MEVGSPPALTSFPRDDIAGVTGVVARSVARACRPQPDASLRPASASAKARNDAERIMRTSPIRSAAFMPGSRRLSK
jgi:hypothetical protein